MYMGGVFQSDVDMTDPRAGGEGLSSVHPVKDIYNISTEASGRSQNSTPQKYCGGLSKLDGRCSVTEGAEVLFRRGVVLG